VKREFYAFLLLLDLKLSASVTALRNLKAAQIARLLITVAFAIAVAALIYRLNLFIIGYLLGIPELGKLVIARFFEFAFLMFFLALVLSTAFTALATLYRDDELRFLFSLPLSEGAIFTAKYLEIIFSSSWALVALVMPFILAYDVYFKVTWTTHFVLFSGLLLPLVLISGSIGIAAALLLRWLLGATPRRKLLIYSIMVITLFAALFLVITFAGKGPNRKGIAYLFSLLETDKAAAMTIIPHKLIASGLFSILESRYGELQRIILTLLGLCALLMLLTLDMGKVIYYRSYQAGSDRSRSGSKASALGMRLESSLPAWLSPIYAMLFRKDLLEFRRHPLQWGQGLLILAVWAIYLANLLNLHRLFNLHSEFWKMLFFYANFSFACYFAAALAGRFVFPVISLEGPAFWALRSAPLAVESLIWVKFWQAFVLIFCLAGSMVGLGDWILHVHPGLFQVSLLAIFFVCFFMTGFALGMGAIYADFSQRNPARIANSPGAILCVFLTLLFAVLVTTIFAWPTYLHYKFTTFVVVFPLSEWITTTTLIIALGIALTLIPLRMGLRALNADLKV